MFCPVISGLHRPTTGVCAEWAPKSSRLPVAVLAERVLDAALGCLILAIDALGVDPEQDTSCRADRFSPLPLAEVS